MYFMVSYKFSRNVSTVQLKQIVDIICTQVIT